MGRIGISCLFPASWHFSISPVGCPRILNTNLRQIIVISVLAAAASLLYFSVVIIRNKYGRLSRDKKFQRYLARVTDIEATDTNNPNVNYGVVVDCGSSGSRIFVYCWPRHNGNPHDLLDIRQMRDKNRKPVVMKIKPGISEFATSPEKVSDYISPLLNFAAEHVPRAKHKETPLYILCTAGMRILPESQQKAILEDLLTDIPVHFDFLFSDSHAEVISGKQEGVYAWIGINFVLGRFEHIEDDEEAVVEVNIPGSESREAILRKRTAGILDMGGVSTQIAYEVPKTVSFASSQQVIICQIFFCLLWFSFNMSPSIFVLFPESEHTLTMLAEVPPSRPRRKESGGSQANLRLCLFIEVGWKKSLRTCWLNLTWDVMFTKLSMCTGSTWPHFLGLVAMLLDRDTKTEYLPTQFKRTGSWGSRLVWLLTPHTWTLAYLWTLRMKSSKMGRPCTSGEQETLTCAERASSLS